MAKFLISLTLMTFSFSAFTAGTGEMSEKELSNKFIATIQESKIEDQLTQSSEFKACASKSKLEKGKDNSKAIKEIEECFAKNIEGQNPKQLEKLSEKLGLQSYGLVKSKSAEDITKYISKKINKALTGVDQDEKDLKAMIENSKFKNQNIVDQSVFFKLYQTQLGKNILFEISRFCYEEFNPVSSNPNPTQITNFIDLWKVTLVDAKVKSVLSFEKFNPQGAAEKASTNLALEIVSDEGSDFSNAQNSNTKLYDEDVKTQLTKSIEGLKGFDNQTLQNFFTFCSRMIVPLCQEFENCTAKSQTPPLGEDPNKPKCNSARKLSGAACITQSRLEQYRKALTKTNEYIDKINKDPQSSIVFNIADMKVYAGKGETSIDAITSISSTDIMNSQSQEYKTKIENFDTKKCTSSPELADCEVLIDEDQSNFEIDNINLKMTVRNAAEIERIKALVSSNDKNLEQYLKDNGYADILEEIKNPKGRAIEDILKSKFDAKKEAYLEGLKSKVGKYQSKDQSNRQSDANTAIEEVKKQQGQLAQLVMFNNIISSSFELKNAKRESLGRNTSGLEREIRDAKDLDTQYFTDLKGAGSSGNSKNNSNDNNSITGLQFLDSILGFEDTEETPK